MLLNSTTIFPLSKLGYLPVIDASPTRIDTVYNILEQNVAIIGSLELDSLVLSWIRRFTLSIVDFVTNDLLNERLAIRVGDFHTSMAYLLSMYNLEALSRLVLRISSLNQTSLHQVLSMVYSVATTTIEA